MQMKLQATQHPSIRVANEETKRTRVLPKCHRSMVQLLNISARRMICLGVESFFIYFAHKRKGNFLERIHQHIGWCGFLLHLKALWPPFLDSMQAKSIFIATAKVIFPLDCSLFSLPLLCVCF